MSSGDIDRAHEMVAGERHIGLRLQSWHSSMSDPVYAVGSSWFAGMPVRYDVCERALANLEHAENFCAEEHHEDVCKLIEYLKTVLA